jgi:hypothetical protein
MEENIDDDDLNNVNVGVVHYNMEAYGESC